MFVFLIGWRLVWVLKLDVRVDAQRFRFAVPLLIFRDGRCYLPVQNLPSDNGRAGPMQARSFYYSASKWHFSSQHRFAFSPAGRKTAGPKNGTDGLETPVSAMSCNLFARAHKRLFIASYSYTHSSRWVRVLLSPRGLRLPIHSRHAWRSGTRSRASHNCAAASTC